MSSVCATCSAQLTLEESKKDHEGVREGRGNEDGEEAMTCASE